MFRVKAVSLFILTAGCAWLSARAAETGTWTGSGANDCWSTSVNWLSGVLPHDWDSARFDEDSAKQLSNLCDLPGLKLTKITVDGPADGVAIRGRFFLGDSDGFRNGGGIDMGGNTPRDLRVEADVGLHAIQDWTVGPDRTLTATGALFDDNAIIREKILHKNGSGTLVLGGSANNSKVYLQVNAGVVELAKASGPGIHATAGIKHIESGATLRLGGTGGDQIPDNSAIVDFFGTLDLNGQSEGIDTFSDNADAGSIVTNSGGADGTFTVGTGGGSCSYPGRFTDGAAHKLALRKTGGGTFTPTNTSNSFTGGVRIGGGTLVAENIPNRGISGVLGRDGTITLEGGADPATLQITGSTVSTNRDFAVGSTGINRLLIDGSSRLSISGSLSGTVPGAAWTKAGTGTLTLSGNNTLTGPTTIAGGTLELAGGSTVAPSGNVLLETASTQLKISAGNHTFGDVSGLGTLRINAGTLTASSIRVPSLRIGTTGRAATADGNPVPEPPAAVLLLIACGGGWWMARGRRRG
jgi:autotransporter-associated beta strand protein